MRPVLAFYGDDFTGSTDVMEVLEWAGLHTVLFLQPPTPQQLASFENLRAFGVAGCSRTMSPAEMEVELRPILVGLQASGASIIHYKTCSTFDSSPEIGSIGKALELGRDICGSGVVPMVVGAPNLGRYQVFGNLFARSGLDSEPYRLDRHPTMSRHPITPMAEADLRMHLSRQTSLKIGLCDILQLERWQSRDQLETLQSPDCAALLFDVLSPEHLPRIGEAVHALADQAPPRFVIGSSGMEYALAAYWSQSGRLTEIQSHPAGRPAYAPTRQLLAITGSCSPVNSRQIAAALAAGFEDLPLNSARLIHPDTSEREIECSVERAIDRLDAGAHVMLHTCREPHDPRIGETLDVLRSLGLSDLEIRLHRGRVLGPKLGQVLRRILDARQLPRVGVAGGDTSGYVARELGITALEAIAPVAPGSPLCRIHADNALHGIEIFFKGGQVGKDNVWSTMLHGTQKQLSA